MEIQELRELKQYVLDNFQNTKDKNLKKILRHIDKLIKRKIIQNNKGRPNNEQTTWKRIKIYYMGNNIKFCNKYIYPIDNKKC